jgi:hypothetical protein
MKKTALLILFLLPCFAYTQDMSLDLGVVSFFMDTKILNDGSIFNIGLGLKYKNNLGGEIRGQFEKTARNEEAEGVDDSLIAVNESVYEIFLLPVQYRSTVKNNFQWRAGAGLYYEYQKSGQKGFLDMPELEDSGKARVNSYTDNFSLHLFGPLAEVGVFFNTEQFKVNLSGGVVPVYFLTTDEKQRMFPLFDAVSHSQKAWDSPYFFAGLDSYIFKYACLTAKYSFAKIEYEVIDFDNNFSPVFPVKSVVSRSLMFEASALIPFKSVGMSLQIGYGYIISFYTLDSNDPVKNNKDYFICSAKMLIK